jgi:hypothetical protein
LYAVMVRFKYCCVALLLEKTGKRAATAKNFQPRISQDARAAYAS